MGVWKETGFKTQADRILKDGKVSEEEHGYLQTHFLSSRDRVSALATSIGGAGTVLLAFLTILVTVAVGVNDEKAKVAEAVEAQRLVDRGCVGNALNEKAACLAERKRQAKAKVDRATARKDDVARTGRVQKIAGGLGFLAFLAAMASQLVNPLPPRVAPRMSDEARKDRWTPVRDRYVAKRNLVLAALVFDVLAVAALVLYLANFLL